MCLAINQADKASLERKLRAWLFESSSAEWKAPSRWIDAFQRPLLPIVCGGGRVQWARWGLIPSWVTNPVDADSLWRKTLNARGETIFQLPSYRRAAPNQRCLIPVNGFYEFQQVGNQRIPYQIRHQGQQVLYLGGLWSEWNEQLTFTIVTLRANVLMERSHNTKKRMPLVLPDVDATDWLLGGTPETTDRFFVPRDDLDLVAEISEGRQPASNAQLDLFDLGQTPIDTKE